MFAGGPTATLNPRPDGGGRSTVFGTGGAVACEHPRAALAGIRTLDAGGNAADACIAMAACMTVLAPMMTGMGGDAFLLFYRAGEAGAGRVLGASGAGAAPRAATVGKLRGMGLSEMPERGGLTVTVPGAVRLWEDAANRLGNMPLAGLLGPAREIAAAGFPVSEVVARYWRTAEGLLRRDEAAASTFLPRGRAPGAGEVFRQPDLAATLAAVTEGGADAFYGGEVARRISHAAREAGGLLAEDDLASHETLWVEPIFTDYRGMRVYQIPPPAQGIAALQILNVLSGFDMGSLGPLSAERVHLEVEAKKLAFRDLHEKIGDPAFSEVPTAELLSEGYAARLRGRIDPARAASSVSPALGDDTTYLCAVDEAGNGCSFINSLYMGFGSGVVAGGTGVALQNRGTSFRLEEGRPNALAPGKRPLHTIIPGLITQGGSLRAVFGNMGGPMQPQGHARIVGNLVDHRMSPQEAVDHPRHFHNDGVLLLEGRFPPGEAEKLRSLGHSVEVGPDYAIPTGGAQIVSVLENGVRACGSDPRKDGCALAQ